MKILLVLLFNILLEVSSQQIACKPPYSCVSPEECGRLHAPNGGVSEILFKCSARGLKVCCPQVDAPPPAPQQNNNNLNNLNNNNNNNNFNNNNNNNNNIPSWIEKPDHSQVDLTQHRNANLLPSSCGYTLDDKIVNGQNATLGQYPWMALIGFTGRGGRKNHACGGTLINDYYVLTAAHCLTAEGSKLTHVTLGEFDLSREIDCEGEKCFLPPLEVPVEKIISHDGWNNSTFRNDIALLKLAFNVSSEGRANIFPICLPFDLSQLNITGSYTYEAVGWGLLNYKEDTLSPILQRVYLEGAECAFCKIGTQTLEYCPISEKQFCVQGFRKKDVCKGDSGGPLTSTNYPLTYQLGITSFKSTGVCGEENVPSVFTRVFSYMKWILDHLER